MTENECKYSKESLMYRVTVISTVRDGHQVHHALFDSKEHAEMFKNLMITSGNSAIVNRWTWAVRVEV